MPLKRTPLTRKTPLTRTGWTRTPRTLASVNAPKLNRVTKSKAAGVRKANAERAAFVKEAGRCFCGCGKVAEVCHEIARGPARGQAMVTIYLTQKEHR